LPPDPDPIFSGVHSPDLVLAAFSGLLASPQPDWPPQTVVTGFPFFDHDDDGLPPEVLRFLDAGPPPIVFTLGSSAVFDAGAFYAVAAATAARLGRRAVLVVGRDPRNRPPRLPDGVIAVEYASFARLFPRAAAIVHQGGIGTTGQAMRAGRPMLVVPFAHDQPDNADRVRRLGIARVVPRRRFGAERVAAELRDLLHNPAYAERAAAVGRKIGTEDGAEAAAAALDGLLRQALPPPAGSER
jgi:UDP:flavonoid glycosyltransferase YjiC (YdhE family)